MASVIRFEQRLESALSRVRLILETTRNPQFATNCPHTWDDKFLLGDGLTNIGLASANTCLSQLGVTPGHLAQLREWVATRRVSIRFKSQRDCVFKRKTTRKEDSKDQHVSTVKVLGITASSSSKVVTTIDEWFWDVTVSWELTAFPGTEADAPLVLRTASGTVEVVSTTEHAPYPSTSVSPNADVDITWLLQQLNSSGEFAFAVDRTSQATRTPRRNANTEQALRFFSALSSWASSVQSTLRSNWSPQPTSTLDMSSVNASGVFIPLVPLFEHRPDTSSVVLSGDVVAALLNELERSLADRLATLSSLFPRDGKLITPNEVHVTVILSVLQSIASEHASAIDYIEQMLYQQLNAAIGKEVGPTEFAEYMRYHNRKLFRDEYLPRPFCYAIRRPEHYPEGVLTIEASSNGDALPQPILTSVRSVEPVRAMKFALDSSTEVTFTGQRYLHSWINYTFSGLSGLTLELNARARQFSSFILLVGRVVSASVFQPTEAIIIQNKDDLRIPLILEQIPTPKEFRDAIESLSPEQQRFAKAYRSMQLASTLFGVCVIQIKPQLEKLLNLPNDALTKEIRLTQDLLELFIKYQIPSDLLSYDGPEEASVASKVKTVRTYVEAIQKMISDKKADELKAAAESHVYQQLAPPPPPPNLYYSSIPEATLSIAACSSVMPTSSAMPLMSCFSAAPPPPPPMSSRSAAPPPAPPAPAPTTTTTTTTSSSSSASTSSPIDKPKTKSEASQGPGQDEGEGFDFTKLPQQLDREFDRLDVDSALRPTIIKIGKTWTINRQASLLTRPVQSTLYKEDRRSEKTKAFDLLDALSRSGSLPVEEAAFHVVLAATHTFTKSVTDTVIQDNVNPIEKVERSLLIVSQTIHEQPAAQLVKTEQLERVQSTSANLF